MSDQPLKFQKYTAETVLRDPDVSDWVKNAVIQLMKRDSIEAVRDTEILSQVMRQHWVAVQAAK